MMVSLIVAMSANRVIGINNQLPWHLPVDLAHFKAITLGKPIVMGRKTFESIGKALPGRENIILTRDPHFSAPGCWVTSEPQAVLEKYRDHPELMIIGGEQIFTLFLPLAARLYLTTVAVELAGDAFFPEIEASVWQQVACHTSAVDSKNAYACTFVTLEKNTIKE